MCERERERERKREEERQRQRQRETERERDPRRSPRNLITRARNLYRRSPLKTARMHRTNRQAGGFQASKCLQHYFTIYLNSLQWADYSSRVVSAFLFCHVAPLKRFVFTSLRDCKRYKREWFCRGAAGLSCQGREDGSARCASRKDFSLQPPAPEARIRSGLFEVMVVIKRERDAAHHKNRVRDSIWLVCMTRWAGGWC